MYSEEEVVEIVEVPVPEEALPEVIEVYKKWKTPSHQRVSKHLSLWNS